LNTVSGLERGLRYEELFTIISKWDMGGLLEKLCALFFLFYHLDLSATQELSDIYGCLA
jgi:hypothetical protein